MAAGKFKNILVPLDGSKNSIRGLDMAISLARQSQGQIMGISVIKKPPHIAFRGVSSIRYPEKEMLEEVEKTMEGAKTRCAQNGVLFESKVTFGDPADIIVKFAKKHQFDVVVIGARGMGAVKEMFFGSVSNYVVHKSSIPIMVVK